MARLTVTVDPEQEEWIEETAAEYGRTKTWVVRRAVECARREELSLATSDVDDEQFGALTERAASLAARFEDASER
jgi:predicted transcriptional regulator